MKLYACYHENSKIRRKGSSGSIFYALAEKILKEGGVVYAAAYHADFMVSHIPCTFLGDLDLLCGSKYVQSHMGNTINLIKNEVQKRKVLFVGTPCQTASLGSIVSENLLLVDFICHGVPGDKVWGKYLKELGKKSGLIKLNMRDKQLGWSRYTYSWRLQYEDQYCELIPQGRVLYMNGFVKNFYLRPSCYQCQFKGTNRMSDITLGDFWGVWDVMPDMDDNKGTSLVMIHSEKGRNLFNKVSEQLRVKECDINSVLNYNPSFMESSDLNVERETFFRRFRKGENVVDILTQMTKKPFRIKLKERGSVIMKKFLKFGGHK